MNEYHIHPQQGTLHGVLDPSIAPVLRIHSGDIVNIETLEADWRTDRPDPVTLQAPFFPFRNPDRDLGHALCGPVFVEEALPGDALKIEILQIQLGSWGWSSVGISNKDHLHRLGFSGREYFRVWNIQDEICTDPSGLSLPASPFPGVLAVAPEGVLPVRTHIPGPHGGNLDCKELTEGSCLTLPVSHHGGLFSIGDGHALQGDGESGGTAIECPFKKITLRISAVNQILNSPLAERETHYITFGFDEGLTTAAYQALYEMRRLLHAVFGISENQAMTLCSVGADLHVTQIVNGIRGVHCLLPKRIWNKLGKERI